MFLQAASGSAVPRIYGLHVLCSLLEENTDTSIWLQIFISFLLSLLDLCSGSWKPFSWVCSPELGSEYLI